MDMVSLSIYFSEAWNSLSFTRKLSILQYFSAEGKIYFRSVRKSIVKINSRLQGCRIFCRECECQEIFCGFRIMQKRISPIDLAVRLQSDGECEDASDSCQTNPSPHVHFTRQLNRSNKSPSKKKKRGRILIFCISFFRRLSETEIFFSPTIRIFHIAAKNNFDFSQERFYNFANLYSK